MIALVISVVGCGNKTNDGPDVKLPNQHKNIRYYFQQGYREDWEANFSEDEHALDKKSFLLFEMWPAGARAEAEYSIYHGDTGLMLTTVLETTEKIMDESQDLYFNKRFIKNEKERENFKITSDKKLAIYNRIQYQTVSYTFTKDGADWKGDFYVTMAGSEYYVITWERKADVDTYDEAFVESISDYRFVGFEDDR